MRLLSKILKLDKYELINMANRLTFLSVCTFVRLGNMDLLSVFVIKFMLERLILLISSIVLLAVDLKEDLS